MSIADLCVHHDFRLTKETSTICPNQRCNCLRILENRDARAAVVKYLAWFSKKDAYEQGSIVFEWYRYSTSFLIPGQQDPRVNWFRLPYIDEGGIDLVVPDMVCKHYVCTMGLLSILGWSHSKLCRIKLAALHTSVFPPHRSTGKKNYNAIENDRQKLEPLVHHLEYLKNLGEVRATRVVSTLVDGMIQVHNSKDKKAAAEVTYLPISMGYRQCYRRYMASLGNTAETDGAGA